MSEPEIDPTVLGMPIDMGEDIAQPISAVVILKGFDMDGKVCHWARATDGMTDIECLGMVAWAFEVIKSNL